MRSDSRSFNSSYLSPSSGRKRKSTPSNWSSFLADWPRSARGQCTRAHAQIGAFFSLACAFVTHSFKSKEDPSSTEPALPEACGEWGRKTRQSLSLREKRNIAKTETPRLKSRRSDRRKVLSLVWRTNPISYLSSSGTLGARRQKTVFAERLRKNKPLLVLKSTAYSSGGCRTTTSLPFFFR
ncbi:hypothetical protein PVK06_007240 [Gossypium arboreum]|uniref:Uncharacterized protein n=1 Tax=Gossypium arboreum TaxID=29729 RepID=A0ABR0QGT4_GOSAR|nr:hypothetical protein PVK06_007240 [Gossypium arboreum]